MSNYTDGYIYGQHDALTWLSEPVHSSDGPLAAFDYTLHARAALVCLARNLRDAACAQRAFRLGNANGWDEAAMSEGYNSSHSWVPGCGKPAAEGGR